MGDNSSDSDNSISNLVWDSCSIDSTMDSESSLDELEMQKIMEKKQLKQQARSKTSKKMVKDSSFDDKMKEGVSNKKQKKVKSKQETSNTSKMSLDKSLESDSNQDADDKKAIVENNKARQLPADKEKRKKTLSKSSHHTSDDEVEVKKIIENEEKKWRLKSSNNSKIKEESSDDNQNSIKEENNSNDTTSANKSNLYRYLNVKVKEEQASEIEPRESKKESVLSNSQESAQDKGKKSKTKKNSREITGIKNETINNNVNNSSISNNNSVYNTSKNKSNISRNSDMEVDEISAILPNDVSMNNHMDHDHDDSLADGNTSFKKLPSTSKNESNIGKKKGKNTSAEKASAVKEINHIQNCNKLAKGSDSSSSESESSSNNIKKKFRKSDITKVSNGEADEISAILPYENSIKDSHINNDSDSSDSESGSKTMTKVPNKSILKKIHDKNNVHENIKFRDDGPVDITSVEKYHDMHPYLKPLTKKLPEGAIIKDHDEVWLLNVPHNITIDMLKNTKISIGNKCKMKIRSDTYSGKLDTGANKSNLLTMNDGRCVIKNKKINGCIKLFKRLPKHHAVEGNVVVDDCSLPLPSTKCRHPLFGADYESAIIIPPAIKDKLNEPPTRSKKEKRHKQKIEVESVCAPVKKKIKVEVEEQLNESERMEEPDKKKKKKKRKCTDEIDGHQEHRPKKKKYNDTEAWDNAQAIEDTLFNF